MPDLRRTMSDLPLIARHAGTVLAGQLAVMAFGVTDTIVAGRHAEASLAALSVASAVYISVFVGLLGTLQALLPLWAEMRGAQQVGRIGASFRQALYLCALACGLGSLVLLFPGPILAASGVPVALHAPVQDYLAILALALPPTLLYRLFGTLSQAIGHPQQITRIQLLALPVKIVLSIGLTHGGLGLPGLGLAGCAWATVLVYLLMIALAGWLAHTQDIYTPLRLWQRMEPPDARQLLLFVRHGAPAGLAIVVEVTSFTLMALFIARQGATAAGAHQIAANLAAVLYMVPLSLSIATSARVSFWRGAGNEAHARRAALSGLGLVALCATFLAATLLLTRDAVAGLYSTNMQVLALAAPLLAWVALYHTVDAVQCFCFFVLRCYRYTMAPMVVYGLFLWGLGVGAGYVLAYRGLGPWRASPSPNTFWIASAAALGLTALVFVWMLRSRLRKAAAAR